MINFMCNNLWRLAIIMAIILSSAACEDDSNIPWRSDASEVIGRGMLVLDSVEKRFSNPKLRNPYSNIYPGLDLPVRLTAIDCEDYECRCSHMGEPMRYTLKRVVSTDTSEALDRLERLSTSPMFDKYQIERWVADTPETRYHVIRKLQISSGMPLDSVASMPDTWQQTLGNQKIREIWVQAALRTDAAGIPLESPLPRVEPIAVRTDIGLYLVTKFRMRPPDVSCLLTIHYGGLVFDLEGFRGNREQVIDAYLNTLRQQFLSDPLAARPISTQIPPPGEMWLRREFEASRVLGAPYFELSTYVLKWWSTGPMYEGRRQIDDNDFYVYLQIAHSFTRSVGVNGTYTEPTPAQVARYRQVVTTAVQGAQQSVCRTYGGRYGTVHTEHGSGDHTCILGASE